MRKTFRPLIQGSVIFIGLICGVASATMKESWALLINENANLAAQAKVIDSEYAQLDDATAKRLPTVSFTSQYNILNDDIALTIDTGVPGLEPIDFNVQDRTYWDTELTATLPLYTGGRIKAGIAAAQADINQNRAIAQDLEDKLFATFVSRYLSVELAAQNLSIRKLALDNLQKHLDRAIRMEEEGTIALTERLQSEVERDKAKREWQQANVDYDLASAAYRALFQSKVDAPAQALAFIDIGTIDTQWSINKVISRSPSLLQIAAMQDKATAGKNSAKGEQLPTIALFGKVELARDDLTALDPTWVAGVQLQWKLFGGGNRISTAQSYQFLSESAALKGKQVIQDLSVYTEQTILSIESAKNVYLALESSQALAAENLRLQQKAFLQGINTALDEIDAELLVTGLQLESHKALFDYYTAIANLYALTGETDKFLQLMQKLDPQSPIASLR